MSNLAMLLPVFVQVTLTFVLLFWMFAERVRALKSKATRMGDIALRQPNWPDRATQVANSFHNQLELPMLFYVLVILVMITGQVSIVLVALAWVFVVFRLLHAWVHTGGNDVRTRVNFFGGCVFSLIAMWIVFAVQIASASTT